MKKKYVLLINPPMNAEFTKNNKLVMEDFSGDLPALGILTLASAIEDIEGIEPVYLDGNVCKFNEIVSFIKDFHHNILCIGLSIISENYYVGLKILEYSRSINPNITHIVGNKHFTSLPSLCMNNQKNLIDFGFYGNEVVNNFRTFIQNIVLKQSVDKIPSLVYIQNDAVVQNPELKENFTNFVDYELIDRFYNHSNKYNQAFKKNRFRDWFKRDFNKSTLIEIARGCTKFRNNNQCTFCSIQYGKIM